MAVLSKFLGASAAVFALFDVEALRMKEKDSSSGSLNSSVLPAVSSNIAEKQDNIQSKRCSTTIKMIWGICSTIGLICLGLAFLYSVSNHGVQSEWSCVTGSSFFVGILLVGICGCFVMRADKDPRVQNRSNDKQDTGLNDLQRMEKAKHYYANVGLPGLKQVYKDDKEIASEYLNELITGCQLNDEKDEKQNESEQKLAELLQFQLARRLQTVVQTPVGGKKSVTAGKWEEFTLVDMFTFYQDWIRHQPNEPKTTVQKKKRENYLEFCKRIKGKMFLREDIDDRILMTVLKKAIKRLVLQEAELVMSVDTSIMGFATLDKDDDLVHKRAGEHKELLVKERKCPEDKQMLLVTDEELQELLPRVGKKVWNLYRGQNNTF